MRLPLVVALWLCACAPTSSSVTPGTAGNVGLAAAEAEKTMKLARAAQDYAEQHCAPLLTREVSWNDERTIGADLAVTFTAQLGHLYLDGITEKDPQKLIGELAMQKPVSLPASGKNGVSAHVAIVGRNLARYSGRPQLPWVFGVIDSEKPQTFSTPGGFVFVTTGLLKKMTNEAQLAGVLAHEISHVVQKDALKKYVSARHKQCVAANFAAWMIENGGPTSPATAELVKFSRKFTSDLDLNQEDSEFSRFLLHSMVMFMMAGNDKASEFATDKLALELVAFAGYDAVQYEQFLTTWEQESHPVSKDRAAMLEALRNGELRDFAYGTAKPELGKVFAPLSAP